MRLLTIACISVVIFMMAVPQNSAQEAIYVIRHAEQMTNTWDPSLTREGRARARNWAQILGDAGISKVFISEYQRSIQTGEIIAESLGISTQAADKHRYVELKKLLSTDYLDESVLIVSHSGVIPRILWEYGYQENVVINKSIYDYLFVIVPNAANKYRVIRLHCN